MVRSQDELLKTMFVAIAAIITGGYMIWIWKQKYKKLGALLMPIPKKWRQVGEISSINLYPLKSGRHKCLNSAECTEFGLKEKQTLEKHSLIDRSFVVFNETTNKFITARDYPEILFIKLSSKDEESVVFSRPGYDDLEITLPTSKNVNKSNDFVIMWYNEKVNTVDCGKLASDWFTKVLISDGITRCRLGYYLRDIVPSRHLKGAWSKHAEAYKKMDDDYMGSYSDLASYMIMTQSSLDDLNSRLDEPVSEYNFRPNIMVKNTKRPYEEDDWDWLKIGEDTVLRSFKLCTRCTVTTINPETGFRNPKLEPLKTLKTYRCVTNPELKKIEHQSPVMGMYMGLHKTGMIKIGDPVFVNCHE